MGPGQLPTAEPPAEMRCWEVLAQLSQPVDLGGIRLVFPRVLPLVCTPQCLWDHPMSGTCSR